jgi:hypothetical protein
MGLTAATTSQPPAPLNGHAPRDRSPLTTSRSANDGFSQSGETPLSLAQTATANGRANLYLS